MKNIFVSSTFKDFQEERDVLRNILLPRLNEIGNSFGEEYGFTDLRWGINTLNMNEEESNREVLSVCFSEIDHCAPYMIVLLGERYGYTPNIDVAHQTLSQYDENIFNLVAFPEYAISVTELEIRYRIYKANGNLENVWFYFRESEGSEDSNTESNTEDYAKMKALKEMILRIAPEQVKTYKKTKHSAIWKNEFQELIFSDIAESIYQERESIYRFETELNTKLGEFFKDNSFTPYTHYLEYEKQMTIVEQNIENFAGLHHFIAEKIIRQITKSTEPLLIRGAVGCGKTVFASFLANISERQWGHLPCFVSCMTSSHLSTSNEIIDYFKGALNCSIDTHQLLFIVDGIEHLASDESLHLLTWLTKICKTGRVKAVITADTSFAAPLEVLSQTLNPLDAEELDAVTDAILKKNRKHITPEVKQALLERLDNPLAIEMALTELTLMGELDYKKIYQLGDGISAIQEYQLQKIRTIPQNLEEIFLHLIETICELLSYRVWDVVCYIALSSNGLKNTTLIELLRKRGAKLTPLEISQIVHYLPGFFSYSTDGRIDFMHACSRKALLQRMKTDGSITTYAMNFLDYCDTLQENDPLKKECWTLYFFAEKINLFFDKVYKSDDTERFVAAKHMTQWLLNFKTPKETGHLGIMLKNQDENNLISNLFEFAPDDDATYFSQCFSATLREPSIDIRLLDEPLKFRVELVLSAIKELFIQPHGEHKVKRLLRFFGYELPIAYRFNTFENRENSKRAFSAIYVSLLENVHLQQLVQQHNSLHRYYIDICRCACELLVSTGYFKDKELVLALIKKLETFIPNANQVDVTFALAQLKKIEGDAHLNPSDPQTYETSKRLYNVSFGNLQYSLERLMAGHFDGQEYEIDELTLVLSKENAALAFAQLLWESNDDDDKITASNIHGQIYNEVSKKWNSNVTTELETKYINAEFASLLSKLHIAIAEMHHCTSSTNHLYGLQYAEKGILYAQEVVKMRGQTITATELLYRAKIAHAKNLYTIDYSQYVKINRSLYREISKWRMISGCRESMLLEADYYDMCIKYSGYDENSAEAKIFALEGHPYIPRIEALRQIVEYADPSKEYLPFF